MNITIDIETIPAQDPAVREEIRATIEPPGNISKAETIAAWHAEKKPGLIEEAWRKTSLDGSRGHIAVIGYAIEDEEPVTLYRQDWQAPGAEADVLRSFFERMQDAYHPNGGVTRPVLIGHYITGFDLIFIFQRAVILGIKPPLWIPFMAKPWDDSVYDTMPRFAGAKGSISADRLAKALGIPAKGAIDGSKVWEYVETGRIDEVAAYCADDVRMARDFHKRMTFASA